MLVNNIKVHLRTQKRVFLSSNTDTVCVCQYDHFILGNEQVMFSHFLTARHHRLTVDSTGRNTDEDVTFPDFIVQLLIGINNFQKHMKYSTATFVLKSFSYCFMGC
jgi:hypothetical protein